MTRIDLEVKSHLQSKFVEKFKRAGLGAYEFLSFKQQAEHNIAQDPRVLRRVYGPTDDYEYAMQESVDGEKYRIIWSIERLKDQGRYILLDVTVFRLPPKLTDNKSD